MRTFENIHIAESEIHRDISKAPVVKTKKAQGILELGATHELLLYSYSISELPSPQDTLLLLEKRYPGREEELKLWLEQEERNRLSAFMNNYRLENQADSLHPSLSSIPEDSRGYTYEERLHRRLSAVQQQFMLDRHTRRAYVPIFWPKDASSDERIPCTIGYQFIYRNGLLHILYFQRSCDFDRFWPSDVYFASALLTEVAGVMRMKAGYFYHVITSLHSFIEKKEEIY